MSGFRVAGELESLVGRELKDLLEATADGHQDLLALLRGPTLAARNVPVAAAGNVLADSASPDTDTEEGLADVDDNTHDLAVLLVLESLADRSKHSMQPDLVDVDIALLLELVRPLATVLVLGILPLGADALLEEMIIGLESEL